MSEFMPDTIEKAITLNQTFGNTYYATNMRLCESCMNRVICKYRVEAEQFEANLDKTAPSPLHLELKCEHYRSNYAVRSWDNNIVQCGTVSTETNPYSISTTTTTNKI